jgi:hypothetical protein
MATTRTLACVVSFVTAVVGLAVPPLAYAASCEALVGKWAWFTGGVATMHPDGTMEYANPDGTIPNQGTWECTDAARGLFTLRWRLGGFVNSLALSADGQGLSSTDMSQWYVTAKRVGASTEAKAAAKAEDVPQTQQAGNQPTQRVTTEDLADDIEQYDDLFGRIDKLAYEKQWEEAIRMCDQLVAKQPNFFGGYALRAWARLDALEAKHGPD